MEQERIHCNRCQHRTLHDLLCQTQEKETQDLGSGFELETTTRFDVLQCCGCKDVVLRRTIEDDIPFDDAVVTCFPPPVSRRPPTWQDVMTFPADLRSLLQEIYRSLDANNRSLPMMGARALIDLLMLDKVGDAGSFNEKLKQLEALGHISSRNREVLSAALDVGSAAAHRGHTPKSEDVNAVMDIVENLLHSVYVLPSMAQRLRITTPARQSKQGNVTPASKP